MSNTKLTSDYYSPSSSASYGGVERLKRLNNDATRKNITTFLQTQDIYTKTKQVRNKFLRRKVMVPCRNYLWQLDLVILSKLKRFNRGYAYILNCIDCFSRFAFSIPIRKKTGHAICEAFNKILSSGYGSCRFIESDMGTEFANRSFKSLLSEHNIKLYPNYSDKGACIVERYNRTLMTRVYKYMTNKKTKTYVDVLQDIVNSYNSSFHRTIQCAPKDVTIYNQADVWRTIYKDLCTVDRHSKSNLTVGDYVRIRNKKGTFAKGYEQNYSDMCYRISEIVHSIPVTYKLSEGDESIRGTFYKEELSKVVLKT